MLARELIKQYILRDVCSEIRKRREQLSSNQFNSSHHFSPSIINEDDVLDIESPCAIPKVLLNLVGKINLLILSNVKNDLSQKKNVAEKVRNLIEQIYNHVYPALLIELDEYEHIFSLKKNELIDNVHSAFNIWQNELLTVMRDSHFDLPKKIIFNDSKTNLLRISACDKRLAHIAEKKWQLELVQTAVNRYFNLLYRFKQKKTDKTLP